MCTMHNVLAQCNCTRMVAVLRGVHAFGKAVSLPVARVGEAQCAQCTRRVAAVLCGVHAFGEVGRQTVWAGQHIPTKSISSHLPTPSQAMHAWGHTIFEAHHLHIVTHHSSFCIPQKNNNS